MLRIEPSPAPAIADERQASASDAALRSTLEAMRSTSGRFRPFVRRLVETELRLIRRRERASRPAAEGQSAESAAEPPPASVCASSASSVSVIPVCSPAAAGPVAMATQPAIVPPAPAKPRMTGEEGWSLAGWTGAALLVLASFISGYPGRIPRPAAGPQVCVALPVNPARLSVRQLARQPLAEIVALADHAEASVRGRMISALVRRQETAALVALARGERATVRQAVPAALAALGRLNAAEAETLSAELVAADPRARERAAAQLASLDRQDAERVGLRTAGARQ